MTVLRKKQFEELSNKRSTYSISIYITTHPNGENKDSIIRLKNQITEVSYQLSGLGLKPKEVDKYMEPLNSLLDDSGFWRHLSDALIILRNEFDFICTSLPIDVKDISVVSDRYYLLPLLSTFNNNNTFFILTLSMNKNRLYEATQNKITQIVTDDILPPNISASAGNDVKQKSLQFRSGKTRSGLSLFHGKGEGKDDKKTEIIKYLTDIDNGLSKILEGYTAPLIVASVDYIYSLFQEICTYKNIFTKAISGNYDNENILLVHEKACEILAPHFNEIRNKHKASYNENYNKTSSKIDEIANAAIAGGIDTLFIKKHKQLWGDIEQNNDSVIVHKKRKPLDNCLLDIAACSTFLKGGKVFLEEPDELPEPGSAVNAILRY